MWISEEPKDLNLKLHEAFANFGSTIDMSICVRISEPVVICVGLSLDFKSSGSTANFSPFKYTASLSGAVHIKSSSEHFPKTGAYTIPPTHWRALSRIPTPMHHDGIPWLYASVPSIGSKINVYGASLLNGKPFISSFIILQSGKSVRIFAISLSATAISASVTTDLSDL